MKRLAILGVVVCLLSLNLVVRAEISRVKEYRIPRITTLEVSSFNGSITWLPVASREEARILIEVVADGISHNAVRNALTQVRIVENIGRSSLLLEARRPALPTGVDYVQVNYFIHATPGQFRQLKAKTSNGIIEIASHFNGDLTLINNNGPIILHSGRGLVNLQTNNAPIELGILDLTLSSSIQTNNGSITGSVSFPRRGSFIFQTANAPIELWMPANTVGTFNLSTSLGTVNFRLGKDSQHGTSTATIRRGEGPLINVMTSNSPISITEDYLF